MVAARSQAGNRQRENARRSPLDRAQQDRILGGNAAELFGLEAMVPA